jgi:hypothetical protein
MNIKRTIITTVVALAMVAMVAPVSVSAVTVEELLAQIAQLQAQLLALQGGSTASGSTPAACVGVTFTRNLTIGSTGSDVKCLQTLLNAKGYTVATTGAGSPGAETTYFGQLTLNAVKAFQTAKGWTPANQVGPLTRNALNALITTTTTTTTTTPTPTGGEGSITVTRSADPASGVELFVGQSAAVAAADVKATGSDVLINRLDLNVTAVSGTSCNVRPWINVAELTVSDGSTSKTISVTQSSVIENTIGSDYTIRADGLGILISKDTTKKLTISVKAVSALPAGATNCALTVNVDQNGIRGTDGAGVSQYGPTADLTSNTFTVKTSSTGSLELSEAYDNPKDHNILVDEDNQTENVVLTKFNLTAKTNDAILRTLVATYASGTSPAATVVPTLKLLDGTTVLASASTVASGSVTFSNMNTLLPKNSAKTLTIVGTFQKQKTSGAATYTLGSYLSASVATSSITAEDATTYSSATVTGSTVTGNKAYAYTKGPSFALAEAPTITVLPGTSASPTYSASARIKINVTANGGDVYVRKTSTTAASTGIAASGTTASGSVTSDFTVTNATEGTNSWKVANGQTATFNVSVNLINTTATGFFQGAKIDNIKWATTDSSVDSDHTTHNWGLDIFKTGTEYLSSIVTGS